MSLEGVQFLNTVISRESTSIQLFEASSQDREVINKVLDMLFMVPKKGSTSMIVNSPSEPEDVAKTKIIEMRELVCTMKELIGILKSG